MKMLLPLLSALVTVVTAAPSSGCHQQIPDGISPGKSVNLTIDSKSGITPREYRLHVPKSYNENTPLPLILSFHGRGKTGKFQEALSQFSNASYGFEGIVVYPEGVPVCDY
jgi:poly(3-hydroxybutyrate) depolymerase